MKTFRRITLLSFFAAVGVGLAICVGVSANPAAPAAPANPAVQRPPSPTPDPPPERAVAKVSAPQAAAAESGQREPELEPAPRPLPAVAVPEPATAPWPPALARWYPPLAQNAAPGAGDFKVQQLQDLLQQIRPVTKPTPPLPEAMGPPGTSGNQSPAKAVGVAPGKAEPPGSKTEIEEEGDGQLSIHLQNADLPAVLDLLSEQGNLNILAGKSVEGTTVSASLTGVDITSALDAILKSTGFLAKREGNFIFVGTPQDFESIEQSMDRIGTRVYRPNYVTAAELQTLITPLLTEELGVASVSSPAESGIATNDSEAGGDTFAGAEVVVVRDYEAVLAEIDQMVYEIDVRPPQVAIEAMILSVKLEDSDEFGVSFELLRDKGNVKLGWGTPETSLANLKFEDGGLKFGFLDGNLGTFLNALESIGDTNVIATPRVTVLNKHRAEIQIGEQKGYVSTTVTETARTQSVEFLDIGAQLRLRPFISSDGVIRMEIHPELSDGSVDTESGFTLPNKEVTQVTTNVMVRDGCTLIIGGLMREQLVTTTTQVPLFGNLPLVGIAFRNAKETIERREVMVLITPHIVYEPATCREGEHAACEFHRRRAVYADKMNPFGKRSIARRYFRLAQRAWAAGDRKAALRFVEISVHFDPLSRAAIDLRSDIWLGNPGGEHSLTPAAAATDPTTNPMDGDMIPGWLLENLADETRSKPAPMHPLDPGMPGPKKDIIKRERLK